MSDVSIQFLVDRSRNEREFGGVWLTRSLERSPGRATELSVSFLALGKRAGIG